MFFIFILSFLIFNNCFSMHTHMPINIVTLEQKQAFWEENYQHYLHIAQDKNCLRHIPLEAIKYYWMTGKRTVPPILWPYIFVRDLKIVEELTQEGLKIPEEIIKQQNRLAREQRNSVAQDSSRTTMEKLQHDGIAILSFEETKISINTKKSVGNNSFIKAQEAVNNKSFSQALPTPNVDTLAKANNAPTKSNSSKLSQPAKIEYRQVEMRDKLSMASDPYFAKLMAELPVCKAPINTSTPALVQTKSDKKSLDELLNEMNFDDLEDSIPSYLLSKETNLDELLNELDFDDLADVPPSYLVSKEISSDEILQLPVCNSSRTSKVANKNTSKLADS